MECFNLMAMGVRTGVAAAGDWVAAAALTAEEEILSLGRITEGGSTGAGELKAEVLILIFGRGTRPAGRGVEVEAEGVEVPGNGVDIAGVSRGSVLIFFFFGLGVSVAALEADADTAEVFAVGVAFGLLDLGFVFGGGLEGVAVLLPLALFALLDALLPLFVPFAFGGGDMAWNSRNAAAEIFSFTIFEGRVVEDAED